MNDDTSSTDKTQLAIMSLKLVFALVDHYNNKNCCYYVLFKLYSVLRSQFIFLLENIKKDKMAASHRQMPI